MRKFHKRRNQLRIPPGQNKRRAPIGNQFTKQSLYSTNSPINNTRPDTRCRIRPNSRIRWLKCHMREQTRLIVQRAQPHTQTRRNCPPAKNTIYRHQIHSQRRAKSGDNHTSRANAKRLARLQ